MKNKMIGIAIVLSALLGGITGCGSNSVNDEESSNIITEIKTPSYMFVQNANGGTFTKNADGNYTLTLQGVSSQTIFFSDRPVRDAGQVETQTFLNQLCFNTKNPPNAAVDVLGAGKDNDVVIVSLSNPVYDKDLHTLQYSAKMIPNYKHSVDSMNKRKDDSIPATFGSVAIFIDDCSDRAVLCGKEGGIAGKTSVTCCQTYKFLRGCDFWEDGSCSFARCQAECVDANGPRFYYIKAPNGVWVDSFDQWRDNE